MSAVESEPEPGLPSRCIGVLAALPEELEPLVAGARPLGDPGGLGVELHGLQQAGVRLLLAVGGVGKVRAAQGAAALLAAGARDGLLVVGVCGGLRAELAPGALVHCTRTVQADFAVRSDREFAPDQVLSGAWREAAPGLEGWFLTSDRPVMSAWRRLRLRRAFAGPCVADMETAAAAAVCSRAGVPWAALRAVTDGAGAGALISFKQHFGAQAGRAAATVPGLLEALR